MLLINNLIVNLPHTLEMYAIFLGLISMVVILGRRITTLLPAELNERYGFYLAPICGLAVLLQLAIIYGWLHPYQFFLSLGLTLVLIACSLALERDFKNCLNHILQTYGFAVICSLPIMYLIIFYNGYNHGTDSITYLSQSQWLQSHAFKEVGTVSPYFPANSAISQYQHQGSRMGATFLLGFFQSLFHQRWAYYIYLPVTSLAFVAGCLAIGSFIRQIVNLEKSSLLALCLIPAFSYNGFIYGAKWGFYPMTNGLAFAISFTSLLSILSVYFFSLKQSVKHLSVVLFPLALLSSAFLLAYNEPFPIFVLGVGLFFTILFIKFPGQRKFLMQFTLVYLLELVVLTNYEFVRIYKNLFLTLSISKTSASTGWPIFWWPTQFANFSLGIKTPMASWKLKFAIMSLVIFFTILIMMLFWFRKTWKENKLVQLPLILLMTLQFAFILAFIKFRYFSQTNYPGEVGLSFLQFKVAKYASPFSLVLLGACLGLIWNHYKVLKKQMMIAYGSIFVLAMSLQIFVLDECGHREFMKYRMRIDHSPFEVFLKIRQFLDGHQVSVPVYADFGTEYFKIIELVALSMQDRKMFSNYQDDGYLSYGLTQSQIHLKPWKASPVLLMHNTPFAKAAQIFDFYPIKLLFPPYQFIVLESKEGITSSQFESNWGTIDRTSEQKVSYTYRTFGDIHKLKLHFQLENSNEDLRLIVKDEKQQLIGLQNLKAQGLQNYELDLDVTGCKKIKLVLEQVKAQKPVQNYSISNIYFTEPDVTL